MKKTKLSIHNQNTFAVDVAKKAFVQLNTDACNCQPHVGYNSVVYPYNPEELIYYQKSAIHKAILETKNDMAYGKGLLYDSDQNEEAERFFNMLVDKKVIKNCLKDKNFYNSFVLDVYYSQDGTKITNLEHVPFEFCRVNQYYTGYIESISINHNWYKRGKRVELPIFNPNKARMVVTYDVDGNAHVNEVESRQAFYDHSYSPGATVYSAPDYYGAKDYLQIDILLGSFYKGQIENGFFPSVIVRIPGMPPNRYTIDEEGDKTENSAWVDFMRNIEDFHAGAENAGKMIFMGKDGEEKVDFIKIESSASVDMFKELNQVTTQKIISAHRLSSPVLVGYAGSGTLSGNAGEISVAAELFYNTVIMPSIQDPVLDDFKIFFRYNGWSDKLSIKQSKPVQFSLSEGLLGKILTINELRHVVGYGPVEWGNVAPEAIQSNTPFSVAQALGLEGEPIQKTHNTELFEKLAQKIKLAIAG